MIPICSNGCPSSAIASSSCAAPVNVPAGSIGVAGDDEDVAHAHLRQPCHQLGEVRPVGDEPRGEVRHHRIAVRRELARELEGVVEPLHGRRGDGEGDVTRHVLEHLLLGAGERDHLVARAPEQLGDRRGPGWGASPTSGVRVGEGCLLALDELAQLLVDARRRSAAPRTRRSIFFQVALARTLASCAPSSSHCSKLSLSAFDERQNAALEVRERVRVAEEVHARLVRQHRVERLAVRRQVDALRERVPRAAWSTSRMNFS